MQPLIDNPFTWLYFPSALALGALHALEPGHAKTLTAAYLIGIKGTKRDALLLGLSVAFTHSLVVVGISIAALWIGRETFTQDVSHWLQLGSGVVVIILGSWMLTKRVRQHHHRHDHDHDHMTDDEHARAHAATLPEYAKNGERPTLGQIVAFGAAGGMIPCPASITVMLLALSIGKFSSGLFAVAGFSLGLAITLVGIGLLVVAGLSRLSHMTGRVHWLTVQAPILSAFVVILSGFAALFIAH
jgi:nickel/cobalt transporter (NicO) family protein